jgi:hypothetical protein
LPQRQNRDGVHGTSPRSSVDQNECENPSEKQGVSCQGGHVVDTASPLSSANGQRLAEIDSELATLIEGWTKLPDAIRTGIAAMVRAVLLKTLK